MPKTRILLAATLPLFFTHLIPALAGETCCMLNAHGKKVMVKVDSEQCSIDQGLPVTLASCDPTQRDPAAKGEAEQDPESNVAAKEAETARYSSSGSGAPADRR